MKLTYATKAPRLATVGKNTSNFTVIKRFRDFNHCPTTDSSKISSNRGWKKLNRIFPVIFRDVSCRAEWWRRPTNSAAQSGWGSFEAAVLSWGCWRLPTRRSAHSVHSGRIFKILSKNMRNFCTLNPSLFVCLIWAPLRLLWGSSEAACMCWAEAAAGGFPFAVWHTVKQ